MATLCRDRVFLDAQLTAAAALPPLPPYRAPRWLAGGHAQTIWPYLAAAAGGRASAASASTRPTATSGTSTGSTRARRVGRRRSSCCSTASRAARDSHYARALMARARRARLARRDPAFSRLRRRAEPHAARLPLRRSRGDRRDARGHPRARRRRTTVVYAVGRLARRQRAPQLARARRARRGARARAAAAVSTPLDLTAAGIAIDRASTGSTRGTSCATLKPKSLGDGTPLSRTFSTTARLRGARTRCTNSTTRSRRRCTASPAPLDYWHRASQQALARAGRRCRRSC